MSVQSFASEDNIGKINTCLFVATCFLVYDNSTLNLGLENCFSLLVEFRTATSVYNSSPNM